MTPGILPFAATRPASLFAPLLRRSAQKVTKKARHRTRRSDPRRADRTALRFSASRGRSDSTVPVLLRDRGDPSPRPFGLIPRSLRCSAPRTAPVCARIRASLHCVVAIVALSRNLAQEQEVRATASAAGCRPNGAPVARRGGGGKVRRRARTMRARSLRAHGRALSEPRSPLANSEGRMPGERDTGVCFFW